MNDEPKERGAASVIVELKGGVITVTHGTDNVVLSEWTANKGDWEKIWQTLDILKTVAREQEAK